MPVFAILEQRTPEWFEWRRNGITATESPIIAGISPYSTARRLRDEKRGIIKAREANPFAVRRGILFEAAALELWCRKHDDFALPACCEWSQDRKYRASFDGLPASGRPVEIKCFGRKNLKEIGARGLDAKCVQHCIMQVQHQLLVAEADLGCLVFYDPDSTEGIHEFEIARDEKTVRAIVERGNVFWECVLSGKELPEKLFPRAKSEPAAGAAVSSLSSLPSARPAGRTDPSTAPIPSGPRDRPESGPLPTLWF